MNAEMKSKKWLFGALGLQIGVGYTLSFLVFFFGSLITGVGFGDGIWMPILGWSVVLVFVGVLVAMILRRTRELRREDAELQATEQKTVGV
jgi:ferrous iron transport protein B